MSSAGLPHSRKHRQRHGQFQRTGKIHHENGKRPGNISCQQIRQAASQQSIGYQCIRQMGSFVLRGRFEFLRLLNHRDNFVIPAAAVLLGHLYDTLAFFHHSAGVDHRVRPLGNRNGFAGERGLVNHDLPLDNHAIHRNQAAHPHRDGIPGLDLVERNQDLPPPVYEARHDPHSVTCTVPNHPQIFYGSIPPAVRPGSTGTSQSPPWRNPGEP